MVCLWIHPEIMAESPGGIADYKVWCFNGEPQFTLVCTERYSDEGLKETFYDEKWERMSLRRQEHGNSQDEIERPHSFKVMKEIAANLSENIPFSRIDFYEVNEKCYFGEITLYPASGMEGFVPEKWDTALGEWLKLPESVGGQTVRKLPTWV